jgi:hypothetical protein
MRRQVKIKTPFKRAYEILSRGIITEIEIRTLRRNIRYGFKDVLSFEERYDLLSLFEDRRLDLTRDQQAKGIAWLKNMHFRLNGSQRRSSKISLDHLRVIRNFSHFTFEGFRSEVRGGIQIETKCIYRTHSKQGEYFDYTVNPSWFGADVNYYDVHGRCREQNIKLLKAGAA